MEKIMIAATVLRQPLGNKGPAFTCKVTVKIEGKRIYGLAYVKGMEFISAAEDFAICDQTEMEAVREMYDWILTKLEAECLTMQET